MRLAFALNRTLDELRSSLQADRYPLYYAYMMLEGLPQDRLEATIARGAACISQHVIPGASIQSDSITLPKVKQEQEQKEEEIKVSFGEAAKLMGAFQKKKHK